MNKNQNSAKIKPFDTYPAPLNKVKEYTILNSRSAEIKGYYLTKFFIKLAKSFALCLSWKAAYRIGAWMGLLFYRLRIYKHVAMTNLDIAFGNSRSTEEKERIYRESMINCGRVIINYLRLPYMGEMFWKEKCRWKNEEIFKSAINRKKGALIIAGHIGMMDIACGKIGMSGYPVAVVGKKMMNPVLDKFLIDTRNAMNLGTIKNRNSMKRILKGIRNGEAIVMPLDQNMKRSVGVFINWMGHQACSVRSAALVALRTGAPVLAGFMKQVGPDEFELIVAEEIKWEKWPDDPEKEILINIQKQSDAIQKIIYKHPELWFWIHRRWNTQPVGMKKLYKHNGGPA